jgi:hypothetical protein
MSQALTVPTHFANIAELSQGFLDRVEEDTLILYGPVPHEEGSRIDFAVLLADGSPAIEGTGLVRASVDGGTDRIPETRYDIVLVELSLEGRNEVVFESLVLAREAVSERPEVSDDSRAEAPEMPQMEEPFGAEQASVEEAFDSLSPATLDALEQEEAAAGTDRAPSPEMVSEISLEPELAEAQHASLEAVQAESEEPSLEAESETFGDQDSQSWDDEPAIHGALGALEEPVEQSVSDSEPALGVVAELAQLDDGDQDAIGVHAQLLPEPSIPPIDASIPPRKPQVAEPPSEPPPPPSFALTTPPEGLTRPSRGEASDSEPPPMQMQELESSSGLFQYEQGLPIPSRPPLPNLNPTQRVTAAEAPVDPDSEPPIGLIQSDRPSSDPPFVEEGYEDIRLSELEERFEEG